MSLVYVSCEIGLLDERGRQVVGETARGVYEALDVETYRRWRPLGHLKRLLSPRERFGRRYMIDEVWRRENEPYAAQGVPAPASERKRGCGCASKG